MAEIKVEDYLNGAVDIGDTDLFDLTVDLGGGNFRSDKLPMAVLKLIFLGIRRFKVSKSFADFTNVAADQNIEIFELPAGFELSKVTTRHETAWGDGGVNITEATSKVGILGEFDRYSPGGEFDIFQPVGDTIFDSNVLGFLENWNVVTSVRATIAVVGDTLDKLTSGDVDYYIFIDQIK